MLPKRCASSSPTASTCPAASSTVSATRIPKKCVASSTTPATPPRNCADSPGTAPTGLAPVERRLLHKQWVSYVPAPTGLAPVERRLLHKQWVSYVPAPTGLAPV